MPTQSQIDKLLQERYTLKNETSWDDISKRVSVIHQPMHQYILNKQYIPSSPTLMNANTNGERVGTLSSCFPMKIEDSMDKIMEAMSESARVTQFGGGVGYMYDNIRGANELVKSTGRASGGTLSFIGINNAILDGVMQGGCFTKDTYVATTNGPKKIIDIEEGQYVYTYSDKLTLRKASKVFKTKENAEVWKLVTDKGLELYATPDHRFMTNYNFGNREYIELKDLIPGKKLIGLSDTKIKSFHSTSPEPVSIITDFVVSVGFSHYETVYDIEVEDTHNFIVCNSDMTSGVAVHNSRRGAGMIQLNIYHPDIVLFINAKKDTSKYNRNNFSVRVPNRFYEILESEPDRVFKTINVVDKEEHDLVDSDGIAYTYKMLWDKVIENAWLTAEPGIFNCDIAYNQCTVTNVDSDVLSNPCLTGDTLIAVADGRNVVPIKQLVDEGVDVPVYTVNHNGEIEIKPFINARMTRENADVYAVEFDSGMVIKCTDNHKFITTDGLKVEAKNLKSGDSIKNINKHTLTLGEALYNKSETKHSNNGSYFYLENNGNLISEHRLLVENYYGKIDSDSVVHHKDFNSLNNSISNLQVMPAEQHRKLHANRMKGSKNPIFKVKDTKKWRETLSKNTLGSKNPNFNGKTNDELIDILKNYHNPLNIISKNEMIRLGFPKIISSTKRKYRLPYKEYAKSANLIYVRDDVFTNLMLKYNNLINNNMRFIFDPIESDFIINRKCEHCGREYTVDYEHRQSTYCSASCIHKETDKPYMFDGYKFSEKYLNTKIVKDRIVKTLNVYNQYKLGGFVNFKKENKLALSIIRPNNPFAPSVEFIKTHCNNVNTIDDVIAVAEENLINFKDKHEMSEAVTGFNHKVVSVKYIGKENVYDGTVEGSHSILIGGKTFVNDYDRTSYEFILSSNCSEYSNIPYSACNLGSINLSNLVDPMGVFDHDKFKEIIHQSVIMLDMTIDVNNFPIDKIKEITTKIRPLGLGFMGLAHAMFKLGLSYKSKEGLEFAQYIIKTMTLEGMRQSIETAKYFEPYEAFDYDLFVKANKRMFDDDEFAELLPDLKKYGIRNSCITSIAPTGSISYIANTSSGIEPVFALAYTRKIEKTNGTYEEVYITDDVFEQYLDNVYKDKKDDILKEVVSNGGSCQKSKILTKEEKNIFLTAGDLTPMEHLDMLGTVAKYTSLSISKTINLPKDISKDKVAEVYLEAYKKGIIGVTVYRDGCRDGILVTKKEDNSLVSIDRHSPKRPKEVDCEVIITSVKGRQYYVIIGLLDGTPYEVFTGENYNVTGDTFIPRSVHSGKVRKINKRKYVLVTDNDVEYDISKGHSMEEANALSRQISLSLRHNTPIHFIVEQLTKSDDLTDFPKVISRSLKKYISDKTESTQNCDNCGTKLLYTDGCVSCPECGFSKCS